MVADVVFITGFSVQVARGGYYTLTVWHRNAGGGRMHEAEYCELTWAETFDTILAEVHGRRPGWPAGEGWLQPPIFGFDGSPT